MKNKRNVLYSLIIMLAGVIPFPAQAQQKHGAQDSVFQPSYGQIMLGEQIRWVFANTGILEADDGSVWFVGVGATGKLYRYDGKTITVF